MAEKSNKDLAARFARTASTPVPQTKTQTPSSEKHSATQSSREEPDQGSKFTVIFSRVEAEDFDELLLGLRRRLARRVDKSEVVRALLAICSSDPSLENQLVDHLRHRGNP